MFSTFYKCIKMSRLCHLTRHNRHRTQPTGKIDLSCSLQHICIYPCVMIAWCSPNTPILCVSITQPHSTAYWWVHCKSSSLSVFTNNEVTWPITSSPVGLATCMAQIYKEDDQGHYPLYCKIALETLNFKTLGQFNSFVICLIKSQSFW